MDDKQRPAATPPTTKNKHVNRVCNMLRKRGLAEKYEHPGIYCIKLNSQIVYIGKSNNMLERVAQHYVGILTGSERKYRIISEIQQKKSYPVEFDVLYYAKKQTHQDVIEEIGQKEGELIRQYLPVLNTQIPKEDNWRRWDVKEIDAKAVLSMFLCPADHDQ